jgi:hypothetical protein
MISTQPERCLTDSINAVDLILQNPAFGPAEIRELTEIFVDKSNQVGILDCIYRNLD